MEENTGLINLVEYKIGDEDIKLSSAVVKKYLVVGNPSAVNDQEVGMFLKLCKGQRLNPFLREAYLIKFGQESAQMIIGKEAFEKRAENNQGYKGCKSGIIVINLKEEIEYREGTFYLKGKEELVGGWAKVLIDGKEDEFNTVSLDEYLGRKRDGSVNAMWTNKPATMIRKVARAQALRTAFPSAMSNLYIAEEMGVDHELPTDKINVEDRMREENKVPEPPKMATNKEKQLLMNIARTKGLVDEKDVSKLEEFATKCKFNLRNLTSEQCSKLIELVKVYEEVKEESEQIQDVSFEPVEGNSSEEPPTEEEISQNEEETEPDPF